MLTKPAPLEAAHVQQLCKELAPHSTPVVIPVEPQTEESYNNCFEIVSNQVDQNGGDIVIGWALWEIPNTMLEAEFHAVWRRASDGQLIDLNPREFWYAQVHFLPDLLRSYDGSPVDNVRRSLCNDAKLKQYIYLKGRKFALMNAPVLAGHHGVVDRTKVPPQWIKDHNAITKQLNALIPYLSKLSSARQS